MKLLDRGGGRSGEEITKKKLNCSSCYEIGDATSDVHSSHETWIWQWTKLPADRASSLNTITNRFIVLPEMKHRMWKLLTQQSDKKSKRRASVERDFLKKVFSFTLREAFVLLLRKFLIFNIDRKKSLNADCWEYARALSSEIFHILLTSVVFGRLFSSQLAPSAAWCQPGAGRYLWILRNSSMTNCMESKSYF